MNPTTDELIKEGLESFSLKLSKIDEKCKRINHDFKEFKEMVMIWKREDMKDIDFLKEEISKIKQTLGEK